MQGKLSKSAGPSWPITTTWFFQPRLHFPTPNAEKKSFGPLGTLLEWPWHCGDDARCSRLAPGCVQGMRSESDVRSCWCVDGVLWLLISTLLQIRNHFAEKVSHFKAPESRKLKENFVREDDATSGWLRRMYAKNDCQSWRCKSWARCISMLSAFGAWYFACDVSRICQPVWLRQQSVGWRFEWMSVKVNHLHS